MRAFRALLHIEAATLMRDKATLTLTFLFPVLFILVFGFLMRDTGGANSAHLGLFVPAGVSTQALDTALSQAGSITVTRYDNREDLAAALSAHKVNFGLVWNGEKLDFIYDPTRVQDNYTFQELAQGIASAFNLRNQGLSPVVEASTVDVGRKEASNWFNLVVPGILAFSILATGLLAVSGHITAMKERRLLDRLVVTPMRPVALLAAIATVRVAVVYISTLVTLWVATAILHLTFSVNWFYYSVFVIIATLGMMGLGTVIALFVRKPSSAGHLASILTMVMMFLSGIYFPIEIMPSYLRAVAAALPLTYMAGAMRFATGVTDMSLLRFWAITVGLLALAAILFPFLAHYVVRADRS